MEHRWSIRKTMTGNVIIECPPSGLIRAAMRDISIGGMFVETNQVILPLHAPVTVVFDLASTSESNAGGKARISGYCLQAMIVRRTANGAAVMFLEPDAEIIRSMRDTLYAQDVPAGARPADRRLADLPARTKRIGT